MTAEDVKNTVKIEKLIEGGRGLARVNGEVLFVKGGIPGEEVLVGAGVRHKGYREVEIQEVLSTSPHRIETPCPVYGQCGGCQLQHLQYQEQLKQKQVMLEETLRRVGKIDSSRVLPTIPSPDPYGYRSTIRFVVFRDEKGFGLGFHRQGTKVPIRASVCLLPLDEIREVVQQVQERLEAQTVLPGRLVSIELRSSSTTGEVLLIHRLQAGKEQQVARLLDMFEGIPKLVGQVALLEKGHRERRWVRGQNFITEQLQGLSFRVGDWSFMQSNWRLNQQISSTLIKWIQPTHGLKIAELYAGIGTLGLPLAREGAYVTEVESNAQALTDARDAARANHIGRTRFRKQNAERFLETAKNGDYDVVIVDPPRTGLSSTCRKKLTGLGCSKIYYLSCDAPTLARDLHYLTTRGFSISRIQPFDMFAQTAHVETLVELVTTKENGKGISGSDSSS